MEPPLSHSSPTMTKGQQEPSESMCKKILEKPLLGLGNGTQWSQTSLSPVELPLWAQRQ